jgi:hypothetical protein
MRVRAYEESLLRKGPPVIDAHECNKDVRKGVDEIIAGRKTAGILVGVAPCLQIVAVTPMYAAESISQLLLFLLTLRSLFPDLAYVIYDNACAVVRHLRRRQRESPPASLDNAAWKWLLSLQWVIDRLHFCYHRSCKDKDSAWFVAGVDAAEHPILDGVDTEAAEQIFSVANRWQVVFVSDVCTATPTL